MSRALRTRFASVAVMFAVLAIAASAQQARSVTGTVLNGQDKPVPQAIVYLKNTKTLVIKTYISEPDGKFRFNALSPTVDYEIYADLNGRKSDVKTVSSFDSRPNVHINLRVQ